MQPFGVRLLGRQLVLDVLVGRGSRRARCRPGTSGPAAAGPWPRRCAGSMSSTPDSLASTTSPSAVCHQRPGRRPLRSSTAPMTVPSVNADAGRPVPRLHQRRVELVERARGRVHRRRRSPTPRDHHQHRVRQAAPAQVQQLEHLVEGGRVADASGVQIGNSRRRSPGIRSDSSSASRVRIQLRLPRIVLISPLCAM